MPEKKPHDRLAKLGFESYEDYLKSDLWADIRRRVLRRSDFFCECCSCQASQAHHFKYSLKILQGLTIEPLVALCRRCHESAHFRPDGTQIKLRDANWAIFQAMHRKDPANAARIAVCMRYDLPEIGNLPASRPKRRRKKARKPRPQLSRREKRLERRRRRKKAMPSKPKPHLEPPPSTLMAPVYYAAKSNLQAYRRQLREQREILGQSGTYIPAQTCARPNQSDSPTTQSATKHSEQRFGIPSPCVGQGVKPGDDPQRLKDHQGPVAF